MNKYNEQGEPHGPWEMYHANGKLWSKGNYINNKKHGPWEWYWDSGNLMYKRNFLNGKKHGPLEWYGRNGELDEIEYYIR